MRLLHTADWHLGRSFFGVSLIDDQSHALDQVVEIAKESRVDAVLLAGDVYDRSTPSADAVRLLDEVLTRLVLGEGIAVIAIAGNHDSGERLGFGARLLDARGLHVAGSTPGVVSLADEHGTVEIVAVPFSEPAAAAARWQDPSITDHASAIRADLVQLAQVGDAAPRHRRIAVAHAFVAGGTTSESERPLVVGNAATVPAQCFDAFAYVALGHLHRPQSVGRRECRYSGSLLKYSFDEALHRKSVSIVDVDLRGDCRIEEVALTARHDVRVLEGTLEELRARAAADVARDDYVMVRLTDRGAVLDSIGKLRALYPNCLRVDHSAWFETAAGERASKSAIRRHTETDLFDSFFAEVTGEAPDDDERRAFADAVAAVRRTYPET